ncbi:MAG: RHS repeat domain-containing protein [Pyrinomonadaceae bacterium]
MSRLWLLFFALIWTAVVVNAQEGSGEASYSPTAATNGPAAPPRPGTDTILQENVNLFSGSLKVAVPLLQVAGRGGAGTTVAAVIQPDFIAGSGRHYVGGPWNLPLSELYKDTGSYGPKKEYYDKNLIRNGAGYGPGVLYTNWNSFLPFADATGTIRRRPAHLTFVDPLGNKHILRDQQIIDRKVTISSAPDPNYVWERAEDRYRNKASVGQVYRSVDDLGMLFVADDFINVPGSIDNQWGDHATDLLDYPILPSGYLYMRDGTRLRINSGYVTWLSDRNGNYTSFTYEPIYFAGQPGILKRVTQITDSLNRRVTIQYGNTITPDIITYEGVEGTSRSIKVQRKRLQDALQDGDYLVRSLRDLYPEYATELSTALYNPEIISSIEFPDSRSYQFKYDLYGELAYIRHPNGSITKYKYGAGTSNAPQKGGVQAGSHWTQVPDPFDFTGTAPWVDGVAKYWVFYRRVIEASSYLDEQTLSSRVTYSRPELPGGDDCPQCVKVDTFDNNNNLLARLKHYYYDQFSHQALRMEIHPRTDNPVLWSAGLEYKTETYNVVNNVPSLAITVEQTWTHGPINPTPGVGYWNWWDGDINKLTLPDRPRVIKTKTTLHEANLVSLKEFMYDEYLNPTDVKEYAYGANQPGALLRRTHTDYLTVNPVNNIDYTGQFYTPDGVHLLSLPWKQFVYAGTSTTPAARTEYEYDNYTADPPENHHAALTSRQSISGLCITLNAAGGCVSQSDGSYKARGNVTKVTAYSDAAAGTGAISVYTTYDVAGNAVSSMDALGNVSRIEYGDEFNDGVARDFATFAYPTRTLTPIPEPSPDPLTGPRGANVQLVSTSTYDYSSGLVTSSTDANNQTTLYSYKGPDNVVDPLNRIRMMTRPEGGGWTKYEYSDVPGNHFVHTQTLRQSSPTEQWVDVYEYADNLGRSIRTYTSDGSSQDKTWAVKDTEYDALSRVKRVSNPYYAASLTAPVDSQTLLWTTTSYDGLGRVVTVTTPDNAVIISAYKGNRVMVTDQAQVSKRSETDALGRLVEIVEFTRTLTDPTVVAESNAADYITTYEYDVQDNLHTVTQGTQTPRTFNYDSLKRLKSASNPESGTTNYEYDDAGNLRKKTDARHVQTECKYDKLNRLISRTYFVTGPTPPNYFDTPPVNYYYDGTGMPVGIPVPDYPLGRLTAVKSSVSETIYTGFDQMGRVKAHRQVVDPQTNQPQTYLLEYGYDAMGNMTSEKYPSGRVVNTEYDSAGRIAGVRKQDGNYYAGAGPTDENRIMYAAHGAIKSLRLGNGLWETVAYDDNRLQPTSIKLGTEQDSADRLQLSYDYGANNNGNLRTQTITVPTVNGVSGFTATQTYGYDFVNRLKTMSEAGGFSQTYDYDPYGNRALTGGWVPDQSLTPQQLSVYNQDNNRLRSREYDDAGNVTRDGLNQGHTFQYDGENRMVGFDGGASPVTLGVGYSYDGDGRRVKKVTAGSTTVFVYSAGGQLVAEYSSNAPPLPGGTSYFTTDNLGSPRAITNASGAVTSRHDYFPFGEEIPAGADGRRNTSQKYVIAGNVRQKFTGYERETETGLDYAQARYYASVQGRFTSADPLASSAKPTHPQTWNRYAYGLNNPLRFTDPNGMSFLDGFYQFVDDVKQKADDFWKKANDEMLAIFAAYTSAQQWDPQLGPVTEEQFGPLPSEERVRLGTFETWKTASQANTAAINLLDPAGASNAFTSFQEGDGLGFGFAILGGIGGAVGDAYKAGREGNIVYRALREGENPALGLRARNPGLETNVASHIMGKGDSNLISTTKDLSTATELFNSGHGVVAIDLNKVDAQVIDVSGGFGRGRVYSRSVAHREVLIVDHGGLMPPIPPEAISIIMSAIPR